MNLVSFWKFREMQIFQQIVGYSARLLLTFEQIELEIEGIKSMNYFFQW